MYFFLTFFLEDFFFFHFVRNTLNSEVLRTSKHNTDIFLENTSSFRRLKRAQAVPQALFLVRSTVLAVYALKSKKKYRNYLEFSLFKLKTSREIPEKNSRLCNRHLQILTQFHIQAGYGRAF